MPPPKKQQTPRATGKKKVKVASAEDQQLNLGEDVGMEDEQGRAPPEDPVEQTRTHKYVMHVSGKGFMHGIKNLTTPLMIRGQAATNKKFEAVMDEAQASTTKKTQIKTASHKLIAEDERFAEGAQGQGVTYVLVGLVPKAVRDPSMENQLKNLGTSAKNKSVGNEIPEGEDNLEKDKAWKTKECLRAVVAYEPGARQKDPLKYRVMLHRNPATNLPEVALVNKHSIFFLPKYRIGWETVKSVDKRDDLTKAHINLDCRPRTSQNDEDEAEKTQKATDVDEDVVRGWRSTILVQLNLFLINPTFENAKLIQKTCDSLAPGYASKCGVALHKFININLTTEYEEEDALAVIDELHDSEPSLAEVLSPETLLYIRKGMEEGVVEMKIEHVLHFLRNSALLAEFPLAYEITPAQVATKAFQYAKMTVGSEQLTENSYSNSSLYQIVMLMIDRGIEFVRNERRSVDNVREEFGNLAVNMSPQDIIDTWKTATDEDTIRVAMQTMGRYIVDRLYAIKNVRLEDYEESLEAIKKAIVRVNKVIGAAEGTVGKEAE